MVVWLEDSVLNLSSTSSWYSSETRACSSTISTGDWFFEAQSGNEAAQPRGPWLPAEIEETQAYKKCRLVPRNDLCLRISAVAHI